MEQLPFPSSGDLLDPGIEPVSLVPPALARRMLYPDPVPKTQKKSR